jgi:hypothetical protein
MLASWGGHPTADACGKPARYKGDGICTKCGQGWEAFLCVEHAVENRSGLTGCQDCHEFTVEMVAIRTLAAS